MGASEHKEKMKLIPEEQRVRFDPSQFQRENIRRIKDSLGQSTNSRHVEGAFFAPSTSVSCISKALSLYTADAAHLSWGSFTLYSMYGRNANMGAFCVAHAIIFGNENKRGWKSFFEFVLEHYPYLNSNANTSHLRHGQGSATGVV